MRQILFITGAGVIAVTLVVGWFTLNQANQEQISLQSRLQSRTQLLADSLSESIEPSVVNDATSTVQNIIDHFTQNQRLAGLEVYDTSATPLAWSKGVPVAPSQNFITNAMDADQSNGEFMQANGTSYYVSVSPLQKDSQVVGALMLVQNADYINDSIRSIWLDNLSRLVVQLFLFAVAIFALVRFVFYKPLSRLAESLQSVRRGEEPEAAPEEGDFMIGPLTHELSKITTSLRQARRSASEEARMRLEKLDSPWTAERLREFMKAHLKDRPIFVVSNGEPYVHRSVKNKIEVSVPAGGVVTAIEPVMEACGGMWIAAGSGDADKEVVNAENKLMVPPDEPKYTLKRVFLSPKETKGYYNGFSNEALWPLCHMAHVRPLFRKEDWLEYRKVNGLFAKSVLEEVRHIERPLILVQDYHLALVPALIKKSRPDAQVAMFWHIPWPSAAQFSICPWRAEILAGLLGADLLGFHTQQYCNNFMETVGAEIEARIDYEHFSIVRNDHRSLVKPFPISIAFPGSAEITTPPDPSVLEPLGIHVEHLALGVDRLDYIKGIPERFRGVEFLLESHPEYREKITLLQIASPTRAGQGKYGEYAAQVLAEADRINEKFGTRDWKPIVLEHRSYSHEALRKLYQLADVMLVTSLHDGMNLVSKEYVAARNDESGVLILSNFTGASRDLKGALVINPYSAEESAAVLHQAFSMSKTEQHRRMKQMRQAVSDYNVYRWSAEIIKTLTQLD